MRRLAMLRVLGLTAAIVLAGDGARAQSSPPGSNAVEFAATEHQAAQQAWLAKKWETAAIHLENAFFAVPTASELRAAIRARENAQHWARAATLAALGLRKYAGDAETTKVASDAIAKAKPHAHEVVITSPLECSVVADTKVVWVERAKEVRFFLEPGHHAINVSWSDDRNKAIELDAHAGGSETMKLEPPEPKPVVVAPPSSSTSPSGASPAATVTSSSTSTSPPSSDHPPPTPKPLGPAVFIVGASLTAIAGAATIVSGLDAQKNPGADAVKRNCVGLGESCPDYQKGRDAQLRTNVLLAVTGGLFVVTGVVGLFFTEWSKPAVEPATGAASASGASRVRIEPVVGLGHAGVRGSF